ncbi:MAG: glycosyl transferase [Gammaproteobacteria bacterium RIFCSPHIGHO2_12_FULL_38_11]|nr:MAG: glycosyl transferase [Gammaproteobacteria bacterium RIFCSPHIGHO2_12_FULL_38_11]
MRSLPMIHNLDIAVLIPCHNEAITIASVINNFKKTLPDSIIYVYDNNSTDNTFTIAKQNGAIVRKEINKGKGNVVRRMFSDIEADIYLLIDGDDTYDVEKAPELISKLIDDNLDMVIGSRVEEISDDKYATYRLGHRFGNALFSTLISGLFGKQFNDVFSGYRIFSRRFVKSFPASSRGFDIETEFTIHSLEQRLPTAEMATLYGARPEGSTSKLNSYKDGLKILLRIILLLKEVRPLLFFGSIFIVLAILSVTLFLPVLVDYLHTGLVQRLPTAILSTGIMLLACISLACGIILDSVCKARREIKRFFYLGLKAPWKT